jgi:plasmid stabilization system protein ParE
MTRRFIVRPLAEDDLDDAVRWYDAERVGLAGRFLTDVERTFSLIAERPLQFPLIAREVRRALLHTFPHAVYFRTSDDAVVVLAVLHLRRNPKVWRGRARDSRS